MLSSAILELKKAGGDVLRATNALLLELVNDKNFNCKKEGHGRFLLTSTQVQTGGQKITNNLACKEGCKVSLFQPLD